MMPAPLAVALCQSGQKEAIKPGESGKISVRFDSKGKKERQAKPITITANTYPNQTILQIKGTVIPK